MLTSEALKIVQLYQDLCLWTHNNEIKSTFKTKFNEYCLHSLQIQM